MRVQSMRLFILFLFCSLFFGLKTGIAQNLSVTVVVPRNFPPQYSIDENGKPSGFAIDIMEQIATLAKLQITYVVVDSWTEVFEKIKKKEADLVPNMGITEGRRSFSDFTNPVETFQISVFVRKTTFKTQSSDDLEGKTIAVVSSNIANKILQKRKGIRLKVFEKIEEAMFSFLAGQTDALAYPKPVFLKLAQDANIDHQIKTIDPPLKEINRAIAIRKGYPELLKRINAVVPQFVKSEPYRQIYIEWYGKPDPFWTTIRVIWILGVGFPALIIIMLFLRNHSIAGFNRRLSEEISQHKQTEEELRNSEYKLKEAQQIAHIGHWELDILLNKLFWSDQIYHIFDLEPREFGASYEAFLMNIHPDDRVFVNEVYTNSLKIKKPYDIIHRLLLKNGTIKHVRERCETEYDEHGTPIRSFGTIQDITEHFLAEEKIKQLNNDLEQRVEKRTVELKEKTETLEKSQKSLTYLLEDVNETRVELETSLKTLKKAQKQLIVQEKLASLGALTAGIAHEIKNPLNFVNNFAELSLEYVEELQDILTKYNEHISSEDQEGLKDLFKRLIRGSNIIHEEGNRADGIVKSMLLHSRGKESEFQPTDFNKLLEEYSNLAYHGMRAQNPSFTATVNKDYDDTVGMIDIVPQDIGRVFLNILNNAFYATYQKSNGNSPIVSIVTKAFDDHIEISIKDNGIGISPAILNEIFNPFFTTKPAGFGTGLGLSLSHDIIVQEHRGNIEVKTEQGHYAEFIVTLPKIISRGEMS